MGGRRESRDTCEEKNQVSKKCGKWPVKDPLHTTRRVGPGIKEKNKIITRDSGRGGGERRHRGGSYNSAAFGEDELAKREGGSFKVIEGLPHC